MEAVNNGERLHPLRFRCTISVTLEPDVSGGKKVSFHYGGASNLVAVSGFNIPADWACKGSESAGAAEVLSTSPFWNERRNRTGMSGPCERSEAESVTIYGDSNTSLQSGKLSSPPRPHHG